MSNRGPPERGTSENRSQLPPSLSKEVQEDPETGKEDWEEGGIAQLCA